MKSALLYRPSALIPVVMSATAFAIVLGYAAMFGVARQADEGAAAHIWQVLMAGQLPIIAFFAIKWIPKQRNQALRILAFQLSAAFTAMFPVWWFRW